MLLEIESEVLLLSDVVAICLNVESKWWKLEVYRRGFEKPRSYTFECEREAAAKYKSCITTWQNFLTKNRT